MSAYREMVYRAAVAWGNADPDALARMERAIAEVFLVLDTVTPEMVTAWDDSDAVSPFPTSREYAEATWLPMLRASPLNPPVQS